MSIRDRSTIYDTGDKVYARVFYLESIQSKYSLGTLTLDNRGVDIRIRINVVENIAKLHITLKQASTPLIINGSAVNGSIKITVLGDFEIDYIAKIVYSVDFRNHVFQVQN